MTLLDAAKQSRPVYQQMTVPNPERRWYTPWRDKQVVVNGPLLAVETMRDTIVRGLSEESPFAAYMEHP
ncbi:hypothetical protein ABC347_07670 [Sphingomonas sp. 1P06PA]|uniref:hypothetical protein n=1 Tax=Sphingomonas sp. 1P06PA TaxID=554121 RepID=UPI0039A6AADB